MSKYPCCDTRVYNYATYRWEGRYFFNHDYIIKEEASYIVSSCIRCKHVIAKMQRTTLKSWWE